MKTLGIIVEYNPFHNGHLYQINTAKQLTGADFVVVVMSGNYVQRGTPAIINKYNRTQMCLVNGVDLVIELPVSFSCASAEYFANGAIALLDKLGIIDFLTFGCECDDLNSLQEIANLLAQEPKEFKEYLQEYLKSGYSFPSSREKAINDYFVLIKKYNSETLKSYHGLLNNPNNILAIEYLKALKKRKSSILPVPIKRMGSSYHTEILETTYSSATAIRSAILSNNISSIIDQVPQFTYHNISTNLNLNCPIVENDFSIMLGNKLLTLETDYSIYFDVSDELANRIANNRYNYIDFNQFSTILKTKEITQTRINRCLLHILLEIKKEDMKTYVKYDFIFYIRILGFKKSSVELLKHLKENTRLPILTKLTLAEKMISANGLTMLQNNIYADHLYRLVTMNKFNVELPTEYSNGLEINS